MALTGAALARSVRERRSPHSGGARALLLRNFTFYKRGWIFFLTGFFEPVLYLFSIGVGVGAIVQVIGQLVPALRDGEGRALHPLSVAGIVIAVLFMYATGLLISL